MQIVGTRSCSLSLCSPSNSRKAEGYLSFAAAFCISRVSKVESMREVCLALHLRYLQKRKIYVRLERRNGERLGEAAESRTYSIVHFLKESYPVQCLAFQRGELGSAGL